MKMIKFVRSGRKGQPEWRCCWVIVEEASGHRSSHHTSFLGRFSATVAVDYCSFLFTITFLWYFWGRLIFLPGLKGIAYIIVHTQLSVEKSGNQVK